MSGMTIILRDAPTLVDGHVGVHDDSPYGWVAAGITLATPEWQEGVTIHVHDPETALRLAATLRQIADGLDEWATDQPGPGVIGGVLTEARVAS